MLYCCVNGCRTKGAKNLVRFPNENRLRQIWLSRIGNAKVSAKLMHNMDFKKLGHKYRICLNHFHKKCVSGSQAREKLKYRALPTINLPGFFGKSTMKTCFLQENEIFEEINDSLRMVDECNADDQNAAIRNFLHSQSSPIVFKDILKWDCCQWTFEKWQEVFDTDTQLEYRIGKKAFSNIPQFETITETKCGSFQDLLDYNKSNEFWAYFDYKYLNKWFASNKLIRQNIRWDSFGYPDRGADQSTIWIGTRGAHTNCHIDSYGFNIVAQVHGQKEWLLFPPEEDLKPSRIPYEESTIFSKLNLFSPNVDDFKHIKRAYSVTLNEGEVLLVPNGWWHYVENLTDVAISINMWIEHENDYINHCREATAQLLVAQLTKGLTEDNHKALVISSDKDSTALFDNVNDLAKTIKVFSNPSKKDAICKSLDVKDLNVYLGSQEVVTELSTTSFKTLLDKKRYRFENNDDETKKSRSSDLTILQRIIEYITNPNVLNPLTENLIEDLWPKNELKEKM